MNKIAALATNTLATSVLLCLNFTAQAQYNPNGSYPGNTSPDFQTSAAGAAAAASAAASSGMNAATFAATHAANSAVNNAAASYQQNASAQFLQSSAPVSTFGQSGTGYTNDGTLMMGGNKIGNPHQVLHDLNVPSFFGVNANRLTNTEDPTYGQGTLAQMENHTLTIGVPAGNVILSRLYLTPTNPYTEGVATPHNNFQTYQAVVAGAQAGSYQLTVANDNKLYAFKTLGTLSTQSQNILIKELPAHSVFIANSDPKGGAVAVRVTQSGDYAAMQNYFATVKPYDFSWRSAMGAWADGVNRPSNISAELGQFGNMPISNNEAGAVFANWVQGSSQVQTYQANLQSQSAQSGTEAFGVLAWDANQNRYVMLDPTNTKATEHSVSGNMPTLGNNQFGFFGMHTHGGSAMPSGQDYLMTQQLGLDQMVVGTNGTATIFADKASNDWQGVGFEFEGRYGDAFPKNPARGKQPGTTVGTIDGFTIVAGEPGRGNSFFREIITLDPTEKDPDIGALLGHEAAGHGAQYKENRQTLTRLPNESRQDYVDRMIALSIRNEAEAVVSEGTESTSRLHPDEKHYVQAYLDGKITKEEAISIISNIYQDRNPGTEPTKTYEEYYREHFEKAVPSENPATVAPSKEESSSDGESSSEGESSNGSSGY